MRRILIPALCLAVLCMCFTNANAGALSQLYRNGQTVNKLEDNDWEVLVNYDGRTGPVAGPGIGDTTLDVNDYLMGMLTIQEVYDAFPGTAPDDPRQLNTATGGFTGVFLVQVATKAGNDTVGYTYTFKAAGTSAWSTLSSYLPTINDEGTVAVFYEDSDPFPFAISGPPATSVATSMATAQDGTALWEFGFTGAPGEIWGATSQRDDVALISIGAAIGSFGAILNVTHDYMTSGIDLIPHNFPNSLVFAQLQVAAGSIGRPDTAAAGIGWEIETDADYFIKPTPEPGTFALLGLGLAGFGAAIIRRRRNKA